LNATIDAASSNGGCVSINFLGWDICDDDRIIYGCIAAFILLLIIIFLVVIIRSLCCNPNKHAQMRNELALSSPIVIHRDGKSGGAALARGPSAMRRGSDAQRANNDNFVIQSHPMSLVGLKQAVRNPSQLHQEFSTVPLYDVDTTLLPAGSNQKNRYDDINPNPSSMVVLEQTGSELTSYINANYIRGWNNRPYIATQGPMIHTIEVRA
jgi:hypothetical protein